MEYNGFKIGDLDSLENKIFSTQKTVYDAPERAVEMLTIPGRNGAIALDQGRWENQPVTYRCGCYAESDEKFAERIAAFRSKLLLKTSYEILTDSYNPDEFRLGLYRSGLEADTVSRNHAGEFDVEFDCKPQRFLVSGNVPKTIGTWGATKELSGEMVTFESDGSDGFKSLVADIEPIQSLNGYDHPWVGGAGKNKLYLAPQTVTSNGITWTVNADGTVTAKGTLTSSNSAVYINATAPTGSYKFNGSGTGSSNTTYYAQIVDGSTWYDPDYGNNDKDVTISSSNVRLYVNTRVSPPSGGITFKPMLRASGTSADFEPYENLCPIGGWDGAEASVVGKNLLPTRTDGWTSTTNGVTFKFNSDGSVTLNGTATATTIYNLISNTATENRLYLPQGEYNISGEDVANNNFWIGIILNAEGGAWGANTKSTKTFTVNEGEYVFPRVRIGNGVTLNNVTIYPQIERGTTATSYEPYQGETHTTALGRTVYGGTVDLVSGVLTVDKAIGDLGTLNWTRSTTATSGAYRFYSNGISSAVVHSASASTVADILSSQYEAGSSNTTWNAQTSIAIHTNGNIYVYDESHKTDDAAAFKTAMNGVQLVYPLANPQTYQLDGQTINTLKGINNVWADSGAVTVEYGEAASMLYNGTGYPAKPLIVITGNGTVGVGEHLITVEGATSPVYIDCETMEIYTESGGIISGASSLVSFNTNEFPTLEAGANGVSVGSGISSVVITPRWWRL